MDKKSLTEYNVFHDLKKREKRGQKRVILTPFLTPFLDPFFDPLAKYPDLARLNNPGISRTCPKGVPKCVILGSGVSKTCNLLQKHGNFIIFEGSATPQNDPFLDPFFDPLFHHLAKYTDLARLNNPGLSRTCQKGVQKVTFLGIPGSWTFWKVIKMGFWQNDPFFGRFWRFSRFWQKWGFWHLSVISLRFWRFSGFWRFWPFLKNRVSKWPHFLPF